MSDASFSVETLRWVLTQSDEGFYLLEGTPVAQRQALSACDLSGAAVLDYSFSDKRSYYFADVRAFLETQPDCRCCVLLNLQLALQEDIDLRRLNFSRDMLTRTGKTFVFGVTPEAHTRLLRRALDFSSFIKLTIPCEEEPDTPKPEPLTETAVKPEDRSVGVDVKVDFSLPRGRLLSKAIMLGNQALQAQKEARYTDALSLNLQALAIREKLLGEEHPDTARSYNNLGSLYCNIGDYPRALEYHHKALAIWEKMYGTEHPDTATSYNNLGGVYLAIGDYPRALEYCQKALAIREKVYGEEHPDTATDYNNLGLVYKAMGDYPRALEYFQKALAIRERLLGEEHPSTATSYNNLGLVYDNMWDYPRALEYYQKALAIVEKVEGAEHPHTAASYNNLGGVYKATGDYPRALEYYQKALVIREKLYGEEHPSTATSYNNLGVLCYNTGDYAQAREYMRKALSIRETALGSEHPDTKISRQSLEDIEAKLKQQAP